VEVKKHSQCNKQRHAHQTDDEGQENGPAHILLNWVGMGLENVHLKG